MTPIQAAIASQHYATQHYTRACINREYYSQSGDEKYKTKFKEHMHIASTLYASARFFMDIE